jgi:hypothetical protein
MPTALEHSSDSLPGLGGLNDAALQRAFQTIDADLAKLLNADRNTFLEIEHDRHVHHDLNLIGRSFLTVGEVVHLGAQASEQVDKFVLKLFGIHNGGTPPTPQADFLALDHNVEETAKDLKHAGLDFLKLATARSPHAFANRLDRVAGDFTELAGDLTADRNSLIKFGADLLQLGTLPNPPLVQQLLTVAGAGLQTLAGRVDLLAHDFVELADATKAAPGGVGQAFTALLHDFQDIGAPAASAGINANALSHDLNASMHTEAAAALAGGHH